MVNSNSAGGPGGVALFEDEGGESENSIWVDFLYTGVRL